MKQTSKKIYIIFAALLLVLPFSLMPFFYQKNETNIMEMDKRYASRFNDILTSSNKPASFESWFSDHLAFRKSAISAFAQLNVALQVSNNPDYVVVGRDGWMFLGNTHADKIDQYRRIIDYDETWIQNDVKRIQALSDYLAERETAFLLVVPPNKENIYPEYLPSWVTVDGCQKYTEVFKAQGGGNLMCELSDILSAKKAAYGPLYPKTDAHWTSLGAYFGYTDILERLNRQNDSNYQALSLVSYEAQPKTGYELTKALGYAANYPDLKTVVTVFPQSTATVSDMTVDTSWQGLKHDQNSAALNQAHVLIIGDSFSPLLTSYFNQTFSDYYFVHFSNVFGVEASALDIDTLLALTDADVVILEIVERHLLSSISLIPAEY